MQMKEKQKIKKMLGVEIGEFNEKMIENWFAITDMNDLYKKISKDFPDNDIYALQINKIKGIIRQESTDIDDMKEAENS